MSLRTVTVGTPSGSGSRRPRRGPVFAVAVAVVVGSACATARNPFEQCWVRVENATHQEIEVFYFPGEQITGGAPAPMTPPLRKGRVEARDSRTWLESCGLRVVSVVAVVGRVFDVAPSQGAVAGSARLESGDTAVIVIR